MMNKLLYCFLLVSVLIPHLVSAQVSFKDEDFHGRWHLVEIKIELDSTAGVGSEARAAVRKSTASQAKVKKQIAAGELAIVTQFNHDGTYSHEVIYADPEIKFPRYRETGTWNYNDGKNELNRNAPDKEITTLENTKVLKVDENSMVLQLRYTEGDYQGFVETVYLRKFDETKAWINKN